MAAIGKTASSALIEKIVSSTLQETLLNKSVLMPALTDYSSMIRNGMDRVDVPRFTALSPVAKTEGTALVGVNPTMAVDSITLNQHKAIAWEIEDMASIQSKVDMLTQIVKDASINLAADIDESLVTNLLSASVVAPDHVLTYTANFAAATSHTVGMIAEARKLLNLQNVPMEDRYLLFNPVAESEIVQLPNFIQAHQYGDSSALQNGEIGKILGFRVLMSNATALGVDKICYFHKSAVGYARQQAAKLESQRDVLGLKTNYVLSNIFGSQVLDGGKRQVYIQAV